MRGGIIGDIGTYRIFAKSFSTSDSEYQAGSEAHDSWHQSRGGFRMDLSPSDQDSVAVQGQAYQGHYDTTGARIALVPPYVSMTDERSEAWMLQVSSKLLRLAKIV